MGPHRCKVTQYRIPALVDKVYEVRPLIRSWKDAEGGLVEERGAPKWFVHFAGSTESLCLGPEKPDLSVGDEVDIIIRIRNDIAK